jgi:Family of unknown function (DUF5407)
MRYSKFREDSIRTITLIVVVAAVLALGQIAAIPMKQASAISIGQGRNDGSSNNNNNNGGDDSSTSSSSKHGSTHHSDGGYSSLAHKGDDSGIGSGGSDSSLRGHKENSKISSESEGNSKGGSKDSSFSTNAGSNDPAIFLGDANGGSGGGNGGIALDGSAKGADGGKDGVSMSPKSGVSIGMKHEDAPQYVGNLVTQEAGGLQGTSPSGNNLSPAELLELQLQINRLSQLSEMATSILSAANSEIQSIARGIKG